MNVEKCVGISVIKSVLPFAVFTVFIIEENVKNSDCFRKIPFGNTHNLLVNVDN